MKEKIHKKIKKKEEDHCLPLRSLPKFEATIYHSWLSQ